MRLRTLRHSLVPLYSFMLPDKDSWETHGFPKPSSTGKQGVFPTPFPSKSADSFASLTRAAGLGLEPRYTPPEGVVLPLDDPAMR